MFQAKQDDRLREAFNATVRSQFEGKRLAHPMFPQLGLCHVNLGAFVLSEVLNNAHVAMMEARATNPLEDKKYVRYVITDGVFPNRSLIMYICVIMVVG